MALRIDLQHALASGKFGDVHVAVMIKIDCERLGESAVGRDTSFFRTAPGDQDNVFRTYNYPCAQEQEPCSRTGRSHNELRRLKCPTFPVMMLNKLLCFGTVLRFEILRI